MKENTFKFRFWCGPTQVDHIAERLNQSPDFKAQAGTEAVFGTVKLGDDEVWLSQAFAVTAKRVLGYDPGLVWLEQVMDEKVST